MTRKRTIQRSITLQPSLIINKRTGEIVDLETLNQDVLPLVDLVQEWGNKQIRDNLEQIITDLETIIDAQNKRIKPAEAARQMGYTIDIKNMPSIEQKSRVNKLAGANLIATIDSYRKNPTINQQSPVIGRKVMLSSVDKQMCSLSWQPEERILGLEWKCWKNHYLVEFNVPAFLLGKKNLKWCLPDVIYKRDGHTVTGGKKYESLPTFVFSYTQDHVSIPDQAGFAGIDLGKVEPFTLSILNQNNHRVAEYRANGRVKQAWGKANRRQTEKTATRAKALQYEALGVQDKASTLWGQVKRLNNKNTRAKASLSKLQAADITKKLTLHGIRTVRVENLSWVTGSRYGSKWNHKVQQEDIRNATELKGIRVQKVNAKNTSQYCHKCHVPLAHSTKTRTVWCEKCKVRMDRDFNASMNIAKDMNSNLSLLPVSTMRVNGASCSSRVLGQASNDRKWNSTVRNTS